MLSVSGLGLFSNAVVIAAYLFSQQAANSASSVATFFSGLNMLAHLIIWAVAAGLFKQQNAQNGIENDLWSWSCSTTADARAETFKEVNFEFLCTSNVSLFSRTTSLIFPPCCANDCHAVHCLVYITCKCRPGNTHVYTVHHGCEKS